MPNIALEQEVIAATITNQHRTFNRSWTATLLWGTDIRSRPSTKLWAHKKWIRCHL